MPQITFSIGGPTTDITGKTSEEIMNIVKDHYATEKTTIKPKKLILKKKLKKKLDTMNEKKKNEETKCEDCYIINAEDFSYYENRYGDCCYKKDMRNKEYEREQENMRQKKINELDRQIDLRGVELLEIIQELGTELKKTCARDAEGRLLLKQALDIGRILDKIAFREDGRL